MTRRILLPYLSAGLGHLVQAEAIAHFLRSRRPQWDVRLMDVARELDDALMQKTFVDLWRVALKIPPVLSTVAFAASNAAPSLTRAINLRSYRTALPKAVALLKGDCPDLIMCAHWACAQLFSMARARLRDEEGTRDSAGARVPLFYVYGELETTYSVASCGADQYFAQTDKTREGLVRLGIPGPQVRRVPFVVDPRMLSGGAHREASLRDLGIAPGSYVVVLSLGGEGIGRTLPFIEAFSRDVQGAALIVLTGRNPQLLDLVRRRAPHPSVIPLGYQDDISGIVAAANALAGKCGTGFATMAMAMSTPLIVTHLGAPNERGNMRFVVRNGRGWYCPRPRLFTRRVMELVRAARSADPADPPGDPSPKDRQRQIPAAECNGADAIAAAIVDALA